MARMKELAMAWMDDEEHMEWINENRTNQNAGVSTDRTGDNPVKSSSRFSVATRGSSIVASTRQPRPNR